MLHSSVSPVSHHMVLDESALLLPRLLQIEVHLVVELSQAVKVGQVVLAEVLAIPLEEQVGLVLQQILPRRFSLISKSTVNVSLF